MTDPLSLLDALDGQDPGRFRVILMPDFTLDHLMRFRRVATAVEEIERAGVHGNSEAHPERQLLRPGGGATNTAHALARLGVRASLVAATSPAGLAFLDASLGRDGVDLSRVRDGGVLTVTGAIECDDGSVMVSTREPSGGLGPEALEDADWRLVEDSDAVLVGNWANPRAADLAAEVWAAARRARARTYTDTSSLPHDRDGVVAVLDALESPSLDAVSVNADELHRLAPGPAPGPVGLDAAGRALSERIHARVDLHSDALTASFRAGSTEATALRLSGEARQATGAGDTWNAGAILGDLLELPAVERLLLSNALTALYVASVDSRPPTWDDLVAFLARARVILPNPSA